MNDRALSRLAWAAFSFVALLLLANLALFALVDPPSDAAEWGGSDRVAALLFTAVISMFPLVGALVASRQPSNPVGWIMLGVGLVYGASGLLEGYAAYALVIDPGSLPRPDLALALVNGTWVPMIVPMGTFLLLLFPDGRLPSKRWRWVARMSILAMLGPFVVITLAPGGFAELGYPEIENPLGLEALRPNLDAFLFVLILIPLSVLACAASVVWRYRRSHGQTRLQIKWLAAAATIAAVVYAVVMAATLGSDVLAENTPGWVSTLQRFGLLTFGLLPLAIGVAMLRHRLYNVDVLINRTLVYGLLTAVLTLTYLAGVALFQTIFGSFTGDSDLAVAISTLAIAALFRPVRGRTQALIDRRFYRKKYDAGRTLEEFSARLRDEIDLVTLHSAVVTAVSQTVQPERVSLWLPRSDADPP